MAEALTSTYWCHMCSRIVNPVMEVEIKCPFCESGFVEEMESRRDNNNDLESDRALSLWAPMLLGMLGGPLQRELRSEEEEEERADSEQDRDSEELIRRRRRSSAAILQLLRGVRTEHASESENSERERERENVILINPFNQTVILQGSSNSDRWRNENDSVYSSLGDYFIGPGLDLLLQHLAENDPSRYGTPPAQKAAVEAMPTVKIEENLQCSVCLEDFEIGSEVKEMPCKHKFHSGCILPWLELHSSCPVCRFQMPADESKDSNGSANNSSREETGSEEGNEHGRRFWVPLGAFFNSWARNDTTSTSPSSSTPEAETDSNTNEN